MATLSHKDAFDLGQHGLPNNALYSSEMWFAHEAGRAARAHLGGVFTPLSVAMSRGYSVRVKLPRGGSYLFKFSGDPLVVSSIEAGA